MAKVKKNSLFLSMVITGFTLIEKNGISRQKM